MAEIGLKGNLLPESGEDFANNRNKMKNVSCMECGSPFSNSNTHTRLGWRETQISGFCEDCFDNMFKE